MRAAFAVLTAALLLSGCTWVQRQVPWSAPPPPTQTPAVPKPEPARPAPRPKPHVEHPAPVQIQSQPQTTAPPASPPAMDYSARCHAMAANRADDARQLGASAADQAKVQTDTYKDCMAQSVD